MADVNTPTTGGAFGNAGDMTSTESQQQSQQHSQQQQSPQQSQSTNTQQSSQSSGGLVDRAKEAARTQLTAQRDRGVDALGSVAQAVRSSTQRLRDERYDMIAGYVEKAADQMESWSQRLREKDLEELISGAQTAARRQPALFIGSAFALGIVGARFIKSSRQGDNDSGRSPSRRSQYGGSQLSTVHDRGIAQFNGGADDTLDELGSETSSPSAATSTLSEPMSETTTSTRKRKGSGSSTRRS